MSSPSAAAAVLWTALDQGVRSLPLPAPAGLCELPLARLSRYEPKPDPATGRLAEEEWLHVHRVRALSGQWFAVRVAGDAQLGLPRAGDWPVLMAVVRLFDEAGWASNTLTDVSIRRLLATMGVTGGGKMIRRVRDALLRFAQVRVLMAPMAASADPTTALSALLDEDASDAPAPALWAPTGVDRAPRARRRGAESRPAEPDAAGASAAAGAPALGRGTATGVLDVAWRDDSIDRITLADVWRPSAGATATTWMDYERYFALTDPVAQRLYQLYAGAAARGEPVPFEHDLEWLRSALGLSPRFKRSRVLEYLAGATAELRAAGILGDVLVEPPGRGADRTDRLVAMPGPVLEAARLFAGLSLEVPRDARVQLAALQALGVHRAEAERLLRADPAQVYEVLCYVLYARRHEPEAIRDPGAYVRRAVAEGYRFAKPGYQAWRAGVQKRSLDLVRARAERPAAEKAAPGPETPVEVAPAAEAVRVEPEATAAPSASVDSDAAALWAGVAAEVRRRVGPRELRMLWVTTQLDRVVGARLDGAALVCAVADLELRAWAAGDAGRALLGEVVAALTGGAVTRVIARLPGDIERAVDEG